MKEKITSNQYGILFFLCSVYYLSTVSSEALGDNFSDSILSAGISTVLGFLLSLPLLILHDRDPETDLTIRMRERFGGFAKVLLGIYALYFLLGDIVILTLMQNLLTSTIFPTVPPICIGLMAIGVGVYGAVKKLESVARTSLFVLVVFLLGTAAIFAGALPQFRFENRQVLLYEGPGDMFSNSLLIFARSTLIPQMVFLLPAVKGKVLVKSIWWNLAVGGFAALLFVFVVHAVGDFATVQLFPSYTLSSISQILPFQRLDVAFTAIWIMTLSVRLSCDFICIRSCIKTSFSRKYGKVLLAAAGAAVLLASFFLTDNQAVRVFIHASLPIAVLALALGFGIPLILLLGKEKNLRR